jgi:hypothetical protein
MKNKENAPKYAAIGLKRNSKPMPHDPVIGKKIRPVDSDRNSIARKRKTKLTNKYAQ